LPLAGEGRDEGAPASSIRLIAFLFRISAQYRMRPPVQLRVPLRPSRIAAAVILTMAAATFGVWLTLPTPYPIDACAAIALAAWARHQVRLNGSRAASGAVVEMMLSSDSVIVVRRRDGKLVAGHVRSSSYVHPAFTSIVWRPDGARWSRTLPLVPDMLDIDDFRKLRVMLRYGRREVTAGAPASQA
jgi:hypothetical protein